MNTLRSTMTGIILFAFAMNIIGAAQEGELSPDELIDDIEEYNGSMGPDNALYGLKIAFESLDESFTFNKTQKLEKKIFHQRQRISEAKAELSKKNEEGAKKAFDYYKDKIKETEDSISEINKNDTGIFNAQKMIGKHQYVLEMLLRSHPDNAGLMNAYNRSIELEDKFQKKTERKLERIRTNEGKHYLKEKEHEDDEENESDSFENFKNELKVVARSKDNKTQVKIELDFRSNKTDNNSIADEILNQLRLNKDNISNVLKIEESDDQENKSILKAKASVGSNISRIRVENRFSLNETNRSRIIDGIHSKLLGLTKNEILKVLEINVIKNGQNLKQERKDEKYEEKMNKKDEISDRKEKIEQEKDDSRKQENDSEEDRRND